MSRINSKCDQGFSGESRRNARISEYLHNSRQPDNDDEFTSFMSAV